MPRFDANLRWNFTEWPMLERYAAAAQAGFTGVEVAFPYEYKAADIAQRLADHGLTLVQILTPLNWDAGERGLACVPGREQDFRDSVKVAIEYALAVGRPLIHPAIGMQPKEHSFERCRALLIENLAHAADEAAKEKLTVIFEPVCRARFPDFLLHRLDEGIAVIDETGRQNLKLCYDTYHVQMEQGALTDTLESAWAYLGHIQIGNPPGRNEPGVGELDLQYFFDLLDRKGWQGWVGCEFTPSRHTLDSLGWGAAYGIRGRAA